MISVDEVMATAARLSGQELRTIGGRTIFRVSVEGGMPVFYPTSTGLARAATNRKRLEAIVERFNATGSFKIPDYKDSGSQNLSYILALIREALAKRETPGLVK